MPRRSLRFHDFSEATVFVLASLLCRFLLGRSAALGVLCAVLDRQRVQSFRCASNEQRLPPMIPSTRRQSFPSVFEGRVVRRSTDRHVSKAKSPGIDKVHTDDIEL